MKGYTMKIYKLIYPDTAENEYRVELDVEVVVTPPDYSNDVSDIDFYGSTELVDFEIIQRLLVIFFSYQAVYRVA